jgi:anti-sigma factor ChrR (cupin superfamily)
VELVPPRSGRDRLTADVRACPDLETLAAWVDGTLPPADRDRIATHAAACESCRFVLDEAARALGTTKSRRWTAALRSWMAWWFGPSQRVV